MKLTVMVRQGGVLVGTAEHLPDGAEIQASLRPLPGHTLHEIEVADHCRDMAAAELHDYIRRHHLQERCG